MTGEELRSDIQSILNEEERPHIDWERVGAMCDETIRRLVSEPSPDYAYDVVFHYLDDPDVRQKDERYADVQRQRIKVWLQAS